MGLSPGTRLGPYEIVAPLGAGGMGEVYRARDTRLGREVAVKILPEHLMESAEAKSRFEREARAVSSLNHPHICTLYDVGHQDGMDFLVMEFVAGGTLTKRIQEGAVSPKEAASIALQVARGLAEAHSRGVLHRDIKPSNVILTTQGTAKIIDFGLARVEAQAAVTQTQGATMGTIGYMSPEQTRGAALDARTDVWSLGVVLAEMLTGANPFQRESPSGVLLAILNEPPAAMPNAPVELQKIVYRALAKNPAARYANCGEMAEDLETFLASSAAAMRQTVDLSAPTATLRPAQIQEYISQASGGAGPAGTPRTWSRWWLAALAVPIAAAAIFGIPSMRARLGAAVFGAPEKHIAVLPFENIGNNPANAALAEGLMDSLSGALSNLDVGNQSLWVVPASVVRARKVDDPAAALRELGATLVVQGSIERTGQTIHLIVNLINAKTLRQIGTADLLTYSGDMLMLQNETISRLAHLMGITVTANMLKDTGGGASPAAFQSYLAALGYIQRYDKPGNLDRAIAALDDAVTTDSNFALGYAELGEAFRLKYRLTLDPKWVEEAARDCTKAVQLDDHLPAAYVTLGRIHDATGEHDLAVQEFQHALQLDPRSADALSGMAHAYEDAGRIADAEATYKKAIALHPDYWDGYNTLGLFYDRQQRYPQALAELRHVIELTPDNWPAYSNMAAAYIDSGNPKFLPDAERALKKSIAITPSYAAYANLGFLYYNEKRYAEAAAMTEKALQLNDRDYMVWDNLAISYEWLKDKQKAAAARAKELALAEQGATMTPRDSQLQSVLGFLYAQEGLRNKAMEHLREALALSPNDPNVLEAVADAYEFLGDHGSALRYAEKSLEHGYPFGHLKNDPDAQTIIADPNFRSNGK